MENTVGIVGGGAAGMTAAIRAARLGARTVLLEGNDRLGRKILSTGNGRCNLGNEKLDIDEYYTDNPGILKGFLDKFGTRETVSFFRGLGLMVKSKNGGLYPVCEQASAVLDVLRYELASAGVQVVTDCRVDKIGRGRAGVIRVSGGGRDYSFDRVVLACGGMAAPKTGSDGSGFRLARQLGHSLVPLAPALVQLKCREDYFKSVAGVRAEAELSVLWQGECAARERGELQLTDYGISGIPVFQLSRVVNYILAGVKEGARSGEKGRIPGKNPPPGEVEVVVNFFPDYREEELERMFLERQAARRRCTAEEFFTGMLHKKLMLLFIKLAGLRPSEDMEGADPGKVRQVYRLCRQWRVHVTGSNSYDNAQVCAGGVPLDEVTGELESKKSAGVYFAGEILDVDGRCGGYNLQWAWCSGYLAGSAAAGSRRAGGALHGRGLSLSAADTDYGWKGGKRE